MASHFLSGENEMFEITEAQRITLHNVRALRGEHIEIAPTAAMGDVLRVHLDHTAVDIRPNGECALVHYGQQPRHRGTVDEIARPLDALTGV